MRARGATTALVALGCALAACGTTTITTNRRDARIYVDGQLAGQGEAEIRQRGTPGSTRIEIRTPDGQRVERRIKRRFTSTTLVAGLLTYAVGFVAFWEYPDDVFVELAEAAASPAGWDGGASWDAAPPGWAAPPSAPAAAPAAPAPPDAVPAPAAAPVLQPAAAAEPADPWGQAPAAR